MKCLMVKMCLLTHFFTHIIIKDVIKTTIARKLYIKALKKMVILGFKIKIMRGDDVEQNKLSAVKGQSCFHRFHPLSNPALTAA